MTIQIKATEQYFPMVLFIMLYKVVLTFESVDGTHNVTIQMKTIEQCFLFLLLISIISPWAKWLKMADRCHLRWQRLSYIKLKLITSSVKIYMIATLKW